MTVANVKVIKGCRAHGIAKGDTATVTLTADTHGVRVNGLARQLWLAGNRKNVPDLKVGDTLNLHNGDPTLRVTIVIQ